MKIHYVLLAALLASPTYSSAQAQTAAGTKMACRVGGTTVIPTMGGHLHFNCPLIGYSGEFTSQDLGLQTYHNLAATNGASLECFYSPIYKVGVNGAPFICPGYTIEDPGCAKLHNAAGPGLKLPQDAAIIRQC
jgi:hypothetical protein